MSKLDTAPYKGVRDFYPEDKFIQNYIFRIWRETAERFGFEEYDASVLEPSDIYKEKSGEEIVNEQTFTFTDRGGREVTMRPEMTPTLARMVAQKRRELGFPLRWYSIPNLFRYEATQRGRLREHWQFNADTFGIDNISADVEIIALADRIMKGFGATPDMYEIRLSTNAESKESLETVMQVLRHEGITNIRHDETLTRGQAYYTGVVFEFFDTHPDNNRSIFGGGRYDNLTALFGDSQPLSAVGIAAGDVTMRDFLETHGLLPTYTPATKLYVVLASHDMQTIDKGIQLGIKFRMEGVNTAIDFSGKKIGDQIKTADKHKVPYVLVFGDNEAASERYSIKELATGTETEGSFEDILSKLKE